MRKKKTHLRTKNGFIGWDVELEVVGWTGSFPSCVQVYCAVLERPLQELREELQTDVTEALASYRKHCCSSSASAGQVGGGHTQVHEIKPWSVSFASYCAVFVVQLVLPRFLRALPVYTNSLRKSEVLLPGLRSSVHQRLQLRCQVLGLDTRSTVRHFYPQLLPVVSPR